MKGDWKSPILLHSKINTQTPFFVYCVPPPIETVLLLTLPGCGRIGAGNSYFVRPLSFDDSWRCLKDDSGSTKYQRTILKRDKLLNIGLARLTRKSYIKQRECRRMESYLKHETET